MGDDVFDAADVTFPAVSGSKWEVALFEVMAADGGLLPTLEYGGAPVVYDLEGKPLDLRDGDRVTLVLDLTGPTPTARVEAIWRVVATSESPSGRAVEETRPRFRSRDGYKPRRRS